jgi:hypothetical protein
VIGGFRRVGALRRAGFRGHWDSVAVSCDRDTDPSHIGSVIRQAPTRIRPSHAVMTDRGPGRGRPGPGVGHQAATATGEPPSPVAIAPPAGWVSTHPARPPGARSDARSRSPPMRGRIQTCQPARAAPLCAQVTSVLAARSVRQRCCRLRVGSGRRRVGVDRGLTRPGPAYRRSACRRGPALPGPG